MKVDVKKDVQAAAKHPVKMDVKGAAPVVVPLLAQAHVKEVAPVDALDALAHVPVAVVLLALDRVILVAI